MPGVELPVGSIASSQEDGQRSSPGSIQRARFFQLERSSKRGFDIVFSLLALVFLLPVLLVIAVAVKLESDGPVLYISERIGRDGKRFRFLKFRTMVKDADSLRGGLSHLNERQGHLFKMSKDPRVTRLGRYLRRYSLDELPQFFNVLVGHMSVVGPRPCLVSEYARYSKKQRRRVQALPGITGLWQVQARTNPSAKAYFNLDRYYVDNWSLGLDMKILRKTLRVLLKGTGQ